jgi:hypothetical protein
LRHQQSPPSLLTLAILVLCAITTGVQSSLAQTTTTTSRPGGSITPPPKRDVPGKRIILASGQLYIPDFFLASMDRPTQLLIWSLSTPWCAEQNFYDARKNAVLLTLNSAAIKKGFADASTFAALLDETNAALAKEFPTSKPIGQICLGSFSAGYTVVRDILRHDRYRWLITDVVLCDSLYAPVSKTPAHEVDPEAMAPFLDFARLASKGTATFLYSHLYPPKEEHRGNTTTLTASYLIAQLHAPRTPGAGANSAGAKLLYRSDLKNFHILGYSGMTNQDHFNHLYASADLIRQTSLTDAPPPAPKPTSAPAKPQKIDEDADQ